MTTDAFDPTAVSLGKEPAKIDPRTLQLAEFIDWTQLPTYPQTFKDSDKLADWGMLQNDRYGCCVMSGDLHQEKLWAALAGVPLTIDEQALVQNYLALSHGDNGLVILDYLKWRRKNPVAGVRKMLGFAAVNWRDQAELSVATSMFRGVLRGILLPKTAQAQTGPTRIWDTTMLSGDGTPGSWGGHLTLEPDYDPARVGEITWGFVQPASRQFMLNYCDECFVVVPNYDIPGFDRQKFIDALKQIDPNADFDPPEPSPVPPPPAPGFDITKVTDEAFVAEYLRRFGDWANIDIAITHRKGQVWKRGWQG